MTNTTLTCFKDKVHRLSNFIRRNKLALLLFMLALEIPFVAHETGRFLAARALGVQVKEFSLGLPVFKLGSINVGETKYSWSLIPVGASTVILGESPGAAVAPELWPRAFSSRPYSQRLMIIMAGPLFNLLGGTLWLWLIYCFAGVPRTSTEIGWVREDSPAARAGLQKGDRVLEVSGRPVSSWDELTRKIKEAGETPLLLKIQRQEQFLSLTAAAAWSEITNLWGEQEEGAFLGIYGAQKIDFQRRGLGAMMRHWGRSTSTPLVWVGQEIFQDKTDKQVSDQDWSKRLYPLQFFGIFWTVGGKQFLLALSAMSFWIFSLNLLPLFPFAGGEIICLGWEMISGSPISLTSWWIFLSLSLIAIVWPIYRERDQEPLPLSFLDPWPNYFWEEL